VRSFSGFSTVAAKDGLSSSGSSLAPAWGNAKLARVDVEGRERFRRVKVVDDTLTLVASEALHDGERVPVTVYFQDGVAPMSATFVKCEP
jgi:hypothetical protein